MNSGEIFVLCIIVIAMLGGAFRRYMWAKGKQSPREDPKYQSQIEALERRVQTLERIVTDRGYDLKREFDKL